MDEINDSIAAEGTILHCFKNNNVQCVFDESLFDFFGDCLFQSLAYGVVLRCDTSSRISQQTPICCFTRQYTIELDLLFTLSVLRIIQIPTKNNYLTSRSHKKIRLLISHVQHHTRLFVHQDRAYFKLLKGMYWLR
jgi:hypothetical protein